MFSNNQYLMGWQALAFNELLHLELTYLTCSAKFILTGFTISGGIPKVGQLLNAAWNLTDLCRFKLITAPPSTTHHSTTSTPEHRRGADSSGSNSAGAGSASSNLPAPGSSGAGGNKNSLHKETADRLDMPPPPSPASSTCSDTGSITTSHSK